MSDHPTKHISDYKGDNPVIKALSSCSSKERQDAFSYIARTYAECMCFHIVAEGKPCIKTKTGDE
jgi:hypothetical protein